MARKVKLDWRHRWHVHQDADLLIIHCKTCPRPVEYIITRPDFQRLFDDRRTSIYLIPRQVDFTEEHPDGPRQEAFA